MKVTVVAVRDGEACSVFKPDADVSELDPAYIETWEFDNKKRTTLSMMRTEETVGGLGLVRDNLGLYNPDSYGIAKPMAYMAVHCEQWTRKTATNPEGDVVTAPTVTLIGDSVPLEVLRAYFARSYAGVDDKVLKKLQPAETPVTGEEPTNSA